MRPLTDSVPKALLKAGGKPLIDYHVEAFARAGVTDIVVNLAWRGDQISAHLGAGDRYGVNIRYSDEGSAALETGGGILNALPLLGEDPFWVVNADVYVEHEFKAVSLGNGDIAHLYLVVNPSHHPDGDFALDGRRVSTTGTQLLTFSGVSILSPALIRGAGTGVFPLAPLLSAAADAGHVSGELFTGTWMDVGTPARLQLLDAQLRQ